MRLDFAAISDVGRVRRDNQDSGYAGPHLLVIADGVGGSARGDVASATAVTELRRLDQVPEESDNPDNLLTALAGAIHRSHDRIAELVAEDPELEGTSTTVTAAIFDGTRIGIGHVGDSRGYLLRDGELAQLTTDHSFVQSLVDEGRITEDEARVHPHRNLILRAVDGVHEPEPDVFTLDLAPGDRVLLCSDGCSGALEHDDLARLLGDGAADHAAAALVTAALDAGSTDNVTVVVADVVDTGAEAAAAPLVVGAAAHSASGRPSAAGAARTGELSAVPHSSRDDDLDPEDLRYAPRPPRRFAWARRIAVLVVLLVLASLVAGAGYAWTQRQYYVSNAGDDVVIYRGVEADVPGVQMHHVAETTKLTLDDLPDYNARQVRDGISATSLDDARSVLTKLRKAVVCPTPTPTPSPSPSASPSAKPSAKPGPSPSAKPSATPAPTSTPTPSPSSPASPIRTPAVCTSP